MTRLAFIGLLALLGFFFSAIDIGFYIFLKQKKINGVPLLDVGANKQTRTSRLSINELPVYLSIIWAAILIVMMIRSRFRYGAAPLAGAILTPPIMALFNARKRTGKSWLILLSVFMLFLFTMFANLMIGLPHNPPIMSISGTNIEFSKTSVSDLMKKGFDIYVEKDDNLSVGYDKLLLSNKYEKYEAHGVTVEKGFRKYENIVDRASYILVKNNVVLGSIGVYGSSNEDIALKDCRITQFSFNEDCIVAAKKHSISYNFEGINLLKALNRDELKKTFGDKLWLSPGNTSDMTSRHYGIKWSTRSEHLFWNEYYLYINYDFSNNVTSLEFMTEIARELED